MPPYPTLMVEPFQVPDCTVPSQEFVAVKLVEVALVKPKSVVKFESVVVADNLVSNRSFVQKRLLPSVISLVLIPNVDVATRE